MVIPPILSTKTDNRVSLNHFGLYNPPRNEAREQRLQSGSCARRARAWDESSRNASQTINSCLDLLDSFAAVIICLIAFQLLPAAVGVIAGLMAAFAPQFSWKVS